MEMCDIYRIQLSRGFIYLLFFLFAFIWRTVFVAPRSFSMLLCEQGILDQKDKGLGSCVEEWAKMSDFMLLSYVQSSVMGTWCNEKWELAFAVIGSGCRKYAVAEVSQEEMRLKECVQIPGLSCNYTVCWTHGDVWVLNLYTHTHTYIYIYIFTFTHLFV